MTFIADVRTAKIAVDVYKRQVVVGVMILLVMFFSSLVAMVPPYATAGALIFVGVRMTSSLALSLIHI